MGNVGPKFWRERPMHGIKIQNLCIDESNKQFKGYGLGEQMNRDKKVIEPTEEVTVSRI